MSTERKPLLSDMLTRIRQRINSERRRDTGAAQQRTNVTISEAWVLAKNMEDAEAARAKDAELIQMAVDMAEYIRDNVGTYPNVMAFRSAAKAAGFTPTPDQG